LPQISQTDATFKLPIVDESARLAGARAKTPIRARLRGE